MKLKVNKQKLVILGLGFVLPALMSMMIYKKTAGGHPASTGAPLEQTCAQSGCHSVGTVSVGTGVNTLQYPVSDSTYIPGTVYTLTVLVQKTGIAKFGFELCALKDSNNTSIGQLLVTSATRTHTISATVNSSLRKYITHSTGGTPATPSTGSNSWTFKWKAPTTDAGKITFYFATNCTNNNNNDTGDAIFLSSFQIKPKVFTSIDDVIDQKDFFVTHNRSDNSVEVNYTLKMPARVLFHLIDMQGKEVVLKENTTNSVGHCQEKIELGNDIGAGVYNVSLEANNKTISRKIFIQ